MDFNDLPLEVRELIAGKLQGQDMLNYIASSKDLWQAQHSDVEALENIGKQKAVAAYKREIQKLGQVLTNKFMKDAVNRATRTFDWRDTEYRELSYKQIRRASPALAKFLGPNFPSHDGTVYVTKKMLDTFFFLYIFFNDLFYFGELFDLNGEPSRLLNMINPHGETGVSNEFYKYNLDKVITEEIFVDVALARLTEDYLDLEPWGTYEYDVFRSFLHNNHLRKVGYPEDLPDEVYWQIVVASFYLDNIIATLGARCQEADLAVRLCGLSNRADFSICAGRQLKDFAEYRAAFQKAWLRD